MGGLLSQGLDVAVKEAPTLFRSMEHIASATEAGKLWVDTLKNDVEPAIGKARQAYLSSGLSAEDAMSRAKTDIKDATFGKKNQAMHGLLQAAEKQGGPIAASHLADAHNIYFAEDALKGSGWRAAVAKDIVDKQGNVIKKGVKISPNSPYSGHTKLETTAKNFSRATQLSLISVPHALQAPLNGLAVNGWMASAKAATEFMTDFSGAKAFALKSGAMSQELAYEMMAAQKGTSKFALLLDPMKKAFSMERRAGIAYSAVMGKHAALDAAETLYKSGGKDKAAEMQLKLLGQDPMRVMQQQGQLLPDDIERAAFRSSSEIMGYRSPLETPMAWEKNAAWRIGTTYKQYGYRTMRLHQQVLSQAYQSEGMAGVAKKALTYATIFPLAGELIKGAEGALTLQNPWSSEKQKGNLLHSEYIDALAAGMGFNLIYAATRSATAQKLTNFAVGPIISTGTDLAQDVIRIAIASKSPQRTEGQNRMEATKQLGKDVLRRSGLPGRILTPRIFPPKKKQKSIY